MISILIIIAGCLLAKYYRNKDEDTGLVIFVIAVIFGTIVAVIETPVILFIISNILAR